MAPVLRGWRAGGQGRTTEWILSGVLLRILGPARPPRAPAGVEEPPSVLLENGKYFSAYTSQRI